jgi:Glyoxalase superfamily protein
MTVSSVSEAKSKAKALRDALVGQGTRISHAQALELVAHQNGARDWNTLHAKLSRAEPRTLQLGDEVRGKYLGQTFVGRIVALSKIGLNLNLSIQLDMPIDTVRFESFSNMRRRIRGVIGPDGRSEQKTSDGFPVLAIDLPGRLSGSS